MATLTGFVAADPTTPQVRPDAIAARRLRNLLHSALLLAGMALMLGVIGWTVAGLEGLAFTSVLAGMFLLTTPRLGQRRHDTKIWN